jgi:uncharacterized alkaline shock family protein YloU
MPDVFGNFLGRSTNDTSMPGDNDAASTATAPTALTTPDSPDAAFPGEITGGTATEADQADDVTQAEAEPVVEAFAADTRAAPGLRGSTTVGDGVVTKIVDMVVARTGGVHGLDDTGISIDVDGEVATITVSLVIEYGHAIKAVAEHIRTDVIDAVEQFLGLDVAAVDIHVSDIHQPATS